MELAGTVNATDYGTAPDGFPEVSGVVESMELSSLQYVNPSGDGIQWEPVPGGAQSFRPISEYPRPVQEPDRETSPHTEVTGVVLHLDTSAEAVAAAVSAGASVSGAVPSSADGRVSGPDGPIRIRIFPDYADTVLWLHGPVAYSDAALSPGLAADMADWEASYYDSLDGNETWKTRSGAAQFTATGNALSQRLAEELSEGFEVSFHSYAPGSSRQLFRSEKYGRNQAAANALRAIADAEEKLQAKFEADKADGNGWFACAPLSGTVFDPNNVLPPDFTLPPAFDPEKD